MFFLDVHFGYLFQTVIICKVQKVICLYFFSMLSSTELIFLLKKHSTNLAPNHPSLTKFRADDYDDKCQIMLQSTLLLRVFS